ncbi:MAG: twin-arginine translocation signal domain-containing protein [Cyanothece sp. SIO1E1]|nr:twin-arginine translocation signal domain-containing protein [Cyanothece sp. SIO1E1]
MVGKSQKISRRRFLQTTAVGATGGVVLSDLLQSRSGAARSAQQSAPASGDLANGGLDIAGVIMATSKIDGKPRIDLISLRNNHILATFEGIDASHAVVPVESWNRFFVHGRDVQTGQGMIWGLEIDLETEAWTVIYEQQLDGGLILHWQPNHDYSLIQYNSTESQALHILDTKTLDLQTYQGGGTHSTMAFFNQDNWLVATDHLGDGTQLRIIDRATNTILAETAVGNWGHGLTVNHQTERAFVWANEGVHMVSLAQRTLGDHLGVIQPLAPGQRSWFCWTPQGGRYSHDQTLNPGDRFSPWLTVIDMETATLEKIETGDEQAGTLQISPDGKIGISGSHSSNHVCLFDIQANTFLGTVAVGHGNHAFFDRDAAFSRDRTLAFVTNPPDQTITAIDIRGMEAIAQINLPAPPQWMKVLTI